MALLVRLREGPEEPEQTLVFNGSPVRLGRNPLNDLSLGFGFVSDWHGVVTFDRGKIQYVDLGSTNGTRLDGQAVDPRVPVLVRSPSSKLEIGSVEFWLSWTDEAGAEGPSIKTHFATSVPKHLGGAPAAVSERQDAADRLRLSYEAYRDAWAECLAAARAEIVSLPAPKAEIVAFLLASEFPQLVREPEFGRMLEEAGVDRIAVGCVDVDEWLERLGGGKIQHGDVTAAMAMENVGAIIEVFADSFLDFRKGYEVFENQLGIRTHRDRTPLDTAQSLDQVIAYLMDANPDPAARLAELKRAFADFAAHQVAVFHAVVEGGRAVLDAMSPESVFQDTEDGTGERLRVRGPNFLSR
ncbi:MAG: FHA domain-containing protein, partial [Myxococcota bacterium]